MTSLADPLRDHMSSPVIVVSADASLEDVLARLRAARITSVVVVGRDERPIGVLSYTDLLQVGRTFTPFSLGGGLLTLPAMVAGDLVRPEIIQAAPTTPVSAGAALLRERGVQRLYVLETGWAIGVFSTRDLMRVIADLGLDLPIGELMRAPAPVLQASDPATSAINLVQQASGACVVVVDGGRLAGVVTQQEALSARDLARDTSAGDIVGYSAISLDLGTPVARAARFALATRARRIVVTDQGRIVGTLSGLDFAAAVARA